MKTANSIGRTFSRNVILDTELHYSEKLSSVKGTLQFFLMSLLWFSPSETAMNIEIIIILASFISGLSIVSLLKMQCHSNTFHVFSFHIIFYYRAPLGCSILSMPDNSPNE